MTFKTIGPNGIEIKLDWNFRCKNTYVIKMVPIDILNLCKEYLYDLSDITNLCCMDRYTYENMKITDLYNVNRNQLNKLNQQILMQARYSDLQKLYARNNLEINNLNHLKYLRVLDCSFTNIDMQLSKLENQLEQIQEDIRRITFHFGFPEYGLLYEKVYALQNFFKCGIAQNSISGLQLNELICDNNINICDLNAISTLRKLSCCGASAVDQKGLSELKLEQINIRDNEKITNFNHMKDTLKKLQCSGKGSSFGQYGLNLLNNIVELDLGDNREVYDLNHMCNSLKILKGGIGLTQDGISKLKLNKLKLVSQHVKNLNHMKDNLENLHLCVWPIDISKILVTQLVLDFDLKKHEKLDLRHMKGTLKILDASRCEKFRQECLDELNLQELVIGYKNSINNLNHMKKTLKTLNCYECYDLTDPAISELELDNLLIFENSKINSLNHMEKSLKVLKLRYIDNGGIPKMDKICPHMFEFDSRRSSLFEHIKFGTKNLRHMCIRIWDLKSLNICDYNLEKIVVCYKNRSQDECTMEIGCSGNNKYIQKEDIDAILYKINKDT